MDKLTIVFQSLNTKLLDEPPSCIEVTMEDLCFTDVPCYLLPDGQRCVIGSWYLSPGRHAVEFCGVTMVSLFLLDYLWMIRSRRNSEKSFSPPRWLKIHTFTSTFIACMYKIMGFRNKVMFMMMPCNTMWLLYTLICLDIFSSDVVHAILQANISYMALVVLALASPDLGDLVLPFEVVWFFLQHYMLLILPCYYIFSGKLTTLPNQLENSLASFLKWWLLSCVFFSIYYFTIVTPTAIMSGLNLNYMLSPPPLPVDWVQGNNYRLISTSVCACAFFIMRLVVTMVERIGRSIFEFC